MDLTDVALFARVAELGSMSAAARERNAPVSQVSRALSRLEALHQARLLARSTHGLRLTEAGQSLLAHGARMLAAQADLAAELSAGAGLLKGSVRVGVSPAMAQHIIAPSLGGLALKHPQLAVDLHTDDRMSDMVREGLDMTIRTGSPSGDALVARVIGSHGRALYASPTYLAQHGTPAHPAELANHRLITNSAIPAHNRWPFVVIGAPLVHLARGHFSASSSGMTLSLALNGLGIVRSNTRICAPLLAQNLLVPVLQPFIDDQPVPVYAVMLQERHRNPLVRACVDYWVDWFAQHE
jgi:DNA-binding transcriptional LysR family regulator